MEKPRFQFRLRTLFVVMTVAAVLVAVAGPPLMRHVILDRQLREMKREHAKGIEIKRYRGSSLGPERAPASTKP